MQFSFFNLTFHLSANIGLTLEITHFSLFFIVHFFFKSIWDFSLEIAYIIWIVIGYFYTNLFPFYLVYWSYKRDGYIYCEYETAYYSRKLFVVITINCLFLFIFFYKSNLQPTYAWLNQFFMSFPSKWTAECFSVWLLLSQSLLLSDQLCQNFPIFSGISPDFGIISFNVK